MKKKSKKKRTSLVHQYQIKTFWNEEYKTLSYMHESFNDMPQLQDWLAQGYCNQFTGDLCDMRNAQPTWNKKFIEIFTEQGWKDVGTSYYRMNTGTILPTHVDLYKKYIELFNLQGQEHTIRRAIIYLEDWQPGHYAEYEGLAFVNWRAGAVVEWTYDTPHMAANLGPTPRYTLQITGHVHD
jgi:hypothetical protein